MKLVEGDAHIEDVDAFIGRLDAIGAAHDCAIQAFDARYVAGRDHLTAAVDRANRAIARGEAIAEDRAIEFLLYAAGRRQINQALTIGVDAGDCPTVVVIDGADEAGAADAVESLLDVERVLGRVRDEALIHDYFDITAAEQSVTDASLEELVIERGALLAIDR